MENRFTPENIALNAVKVTAEAAPPTLKLIKDGLAVPVLRAFTWGLDALVAANTTSWRARNVTRFMYAQTHKRKERA